MPTFKFHCPHCGQTIEVDEAFEGEVANCPSCHEEIVIARDIEYGNPVSTKDEESKSTKDHESTKPIESTKNSEEFTHCLSCGEVIPKTARRCHLCGKFLNVDTSVKTRKIQKRRLIFYSSITLFCVLGIICGIVFYVIRREQAQRQREIFSLQYEAFKHNLFALMDAGTKLTTTTKSGINVEELKSAVNLIEATLTRTMESRPSEFANSKGLDDVFFFIAKAIYGWRLALECWKFKLMNDKLVFEEENLPLYNKVFSYLNPKLQKLSKRSPTTLFYDGSIIFSRTDILGFDRGYCNLENAIGALLTEASNYYLSGHKFLLLFQQSWDAKLIK